MPVDPCAPCGPVSPVPPWLPPGPVPPAYPGLLVDPLCTQKQRHQGADALGDLCKDSAGRVPLGQCGNSAGSSRRLYIFVTLSIILTKGTCLCFPGYPWRLWLLHGMSNNTCQSHRATQHCGHSRVALACSRGTGKSTQSLGMRMSWRHGNYNNGEAKHKPALPWLPCMPEGPVKPANQTADERPSLIPFHRGWHRHLEIVAIKMDAKVEPALNSRR